MSKKGDSLAFCCLKSKRHKDILLDEAGKHHSGTLSGYLRAWFVIIFRLIKEGVSPEQAIARLDEIVQLFSEND